MLYVYQSSPTCAHLSTITLTPAGALATTESSVRWSAEGEGVDLEAVVQQMEQILPPPHHAAGETN